MTRRSTATSRISSASPISCAGTVAAADAHGASVALANGLVLKARWSAAGEHLAVGEDGRDRGAAGSHRAVAGGPRLRATSTCAAPGQVRNRIYLGDHTEFSVHVPELGELMVRLPKSDPLAMRLQPGDAVEIGWRAEQALALRAT